jgi:hypothetical protein
MTRNAGFVIAEIPLRMRDGVHETSSGLIADGLHLDDEAETSGRLWWPTGSKRRRSRSRPYPALGLLET